MFLRNSVPLAMWLSQFYRMDTIWSDRNCSLQWSLSSLLLFSCPPRMGSIWKYVSWPHCVVHFPVRVKWIWLYRYCWRLLMKCQSCINTLTLLSLRSNNLFPSRKFPSCYIFRHGTRFIPLCLLLPPKAGKLVFR